MSTESQMATDRSLLAAGGTSRCPVPVARWLTIVGLMAVELLAVGLLFDSAVLEKEPAGWARLIERAPQIATLCIAMVAGCIVVGGKRLWTELVAACGERARNAKWRRWLVGQLAAWATFLAVNDVLLSGRPLPTRAGVAWTVVWALLALATIGLAILAALPLAAWRQWTWACRKPILVAVPLGLIAWLCALFTAGQGWKFLAESTIKLVHFCLSLIYADAVYWPGEAVVGTQSFQVRIAAACAGYEGIGLICVFLAGYLCVARKQFRFPQALLLLPLGIALVWTANILRIVLLIVIGSAGFPDVALGGFHSQAGWLAFNAIALGLVVASGYVPWLSESRAIRCEARAPDATTAYLLPFLSIVAASMITGALSAGFDWLYGLRVAAAAALLIHFWPRYALRWNWSWQPFAFGAAAFLVWWWLIPVNPTAGPPQQLESVSRGWATGWLGLRTFGYLVTAPLAEELAFRGFLLRRFASLDFEHLPLNRFHGLGFAGSSLLFGLMHGQHWLPATAAGMFFAWAAYRRGNLMDAVLAHATTNALVALAVFTNGAWYLWG